MAKYLDTFESETLGVQPSNWTERWVMTDSAWTAEDLGGSPTDIVAQNVVTASGRHLLGFDTPSSGELQDAQVLTRMKVDTNNHIFGVVLRGSGSSGSETGYALYATSGSGTATIVRYSSGTGTTIQTWSIGFTVQTDTWYWIRTQVLDDVLYFKIWADGNAEPNWLARVVNTEIDGTSSNFTGIFTSTTEASSVLDCSLFSVGTNSDPADLPADEVGARSTMAFAEVATQLDSELRVTQAFAYSVDALEDDARVDQVAAMALWGGLSDEMRVDQEALLVLATGNPCITHWTQAWTITRTDGTVYRFTTRDVDLEFIGNTYLACGALASTAIENSVGLGESGNVEIDAILNSNHIIDQEVLAGLFDGAEVTAWMVPWQTTEGEIPFRIFFGEIGRIEKGSTGFKAEIITQATRAQQYNLLQTYTPGCRHELGDSICRVNVDALQVTGSVTQTTKPTSPATTRKRAFVDTSRAEADGYFDYGILTWTTGDNAGTSYQVESYSLSTGFVLWDATAYRIQVGDQYQVKPGCDKASDTCKTKFSNFANFGGFPNIPGKDKILGIRVKRNEVR